MCRSSPQPRAGSEEYDQAAMDNAVHASQNQRHCGARKLAFPRKSRTILAAMAIARNDSDTAMETGTNQRPGMSASRSAAAVLVAASTPASDGCRDSTAECLKTSVFTAPQKSWRDKSKP